jgi:23S rRNA (uridine2552-2'-O)-methyltransferase
VVDLGAAPGGWSQVAQELIGEQGRIVGVDILPIKPIKGIEFIQGDITDNLIIVEIKNRLNNCKANIILSDISPDISGNYSVDHARSIWLCEKVLDISLQLLGPGGFLICKVFEGPDLSKFIENVKKYFNSVKKFSPTASRKRSSEIYIIAKPLKNISP